MKNFYLNEIENLKKRFIHLYIILMCSILTLNIIVFQFFIYNPTIVLYLLGGLFILSYTYILVRGKYKSDQIIHGYMIIAPLYNFYIMLTFWSNSIGNVVSLFPLPLVAYVFFQKRETILYSIYLVLNILVCFLVYEYFDLQFPKYSRAEVVISDVFLFGFNLLVIILLLIYSNKINKLKVLIDIEDEKLMNTSGENTKVPVLQKTPETPMMNDEASEKLFQQLEDLMRNDEIFKKANLNISMLSTSLDVNYNYLSKIIRCKGYQNFSNYLNVYRINYVKKLIDESNLQKVTLMYIYTEAGFSNQATFNRVFKQIEGITPSEYIHKSDQIGKEN
ncbi:hypothetical protein B0A69_15450 [Chryseobacterium shigense]|uniref:Helix-turn-helix domain-containing protein n=1 Tax=Chryseobacterium shigense TaxID=297244 RepID=A0A1N7IU20_9FLAO|nr:AraC family transcriptional regulator [Chryseobacterium shigense]PQA92429.1 hypothetical protein B0A69_15450 [Chryseobacterium shigense]SIS40517.1 Helix-turn-helix domain-containing protein [Chryseobacterium shigense]